jgi:iron(III) transport system ATP-binding protein
MLRFQSIAKKYTDIFVLKNINFEVQQGTLVALTGESGCGKTTLLRLIAGLEVPSEGSISIDNQIVADKHKWVKPEKRKVGKVFQDYALFPHLTVAQNIAYGLTDRKTEKSKIADILALVGLQNYEKRYPHELSGGQQQRVALARALAPQPQVLLLDEPFSNLDEIRREQLRDEICQIIRETGITAILVTHDTKDALLAADKVVLLRRGELLQYETPQNLYQHPADSYTALFFGKANLIKGTSTKEGLQTILGTFDTQKQLVSIRPEHFEVKNAANAKIVAQVEQINFGGMLQDATVCVGRDTKLQIKVSNLLQLKKNEVIGLEVLHWVGI